MLDLNELAEGQKFIALGAYAVSDDGNLLAYSTDNTGFRAVHAATSRTCAPASCERRRRGEGGLGGLGRRRPDALLHDEDAAKRPYRLYRHAAGRAPAERPRLRGEGRAVQHRRRPLAQQGLPVPGHRQPHHVARCALPARRPARRRVEGRRPARARARVRRRPPRRPLLHPHQRHGPQLPPGHGAGVRPPAARAGRRSCPHRPGRDAGGHRLLPGPLRPARARARPAASSGSPTCARAPSHRIEFPEPAYSAFAGGQPRVRHHPSSATRYQSLVTPDSVFDYDMDKRTADAAQGAAGAGRLRPHAATPPSGSSRPRRTA